MENNKWWGYLHANGAIIVKRWWGDRKDYTNDCIGNPNVQQVFEPFEADSREAAYMIIERELDGEITGQ
jgi:hypothetical protein